jgi:hypothetical protein
MCIDHSTNFSNQALDICAFVLIFVSRIPSFPELTSPHSLFCSYTSKPTGHILIKVWDKDRWTPDDLLGEVVIPVKKAESGEVVDEWYTLQNEPKKKDKNQPPGEIRVKLHYPSAAKTKVQISLVSKLNHTFSSSFSRSLSFFYTYVISLPCIGEFSD